MTTEELVKEIVEKFAYITVAAIIRAIELRRIKKQNKNKYNGNN